MPILAQVKVAGLRLGSVTVFDVQGLKHANRLLTETYIKEAFCFLSFGTTKKSFEIAHNTSSRAKFNLSEQIWLRTQRKWPWIQGHAALAPW